MIPAEGPAEEAPAASEPPAAEPPADVLALVVAAINARSTEPLIQLLAQGQYAAAATGLADVMDSVTRGEVKASPVEMAYMAGARGVLEVLLMEGRPV